MIVIFLVLSILLVFPGLSCQCKFATSSDSSSIYCSFHQKTRTSLTAITGCFIVSNCSPYPHVYRQPYHLRVFIFTYSRKELPLFLISQGLEAVSMSSNHRLSLSLSEVLKSVVYFVQRFCSNLEIRRELNSYPYLKSLAGIFSLRLYTANRSV